MRLLVVNDEPEQLDRMTAALRRWRHECHGLAGVREAIALLQREAFDALVCDVVLADPFEPGSRGPWGQVVVCTARHLPQPVPTVAASTRAIYGHEGVTVVQLWSGRAVASALRAPVAGAVVSGGDDCIFVALGELAGASRRRQAAKLSLFEESRLLAELESSSAEVRTALARIVRAAGDDLAWPQALEGLRQALCLPAWFLPSGHEGLQSDR